MGLAARQETESPISKEDEWLLSRLSEHRPPGILERRFQCPESHLSQLLGGDVMSSPWFLGQAVSSGMRAWVSSNMPCWGCCEPQGWALWHCTLLQIVWLSVC